MGIVDGEGLDQLIWLDRVDGSVGSVFGLMVDDRMSVGEGASFHVLP